jgi:hypothetical protein
MEKAKVSHESPEWMLVVVVVVAMVVVTVW